LLTHSAAVFARFTILSNFTCWHANFGAITVTGQAESIAERGGYPFQAATKAVFNNLNSDILLLFKPEQWRIN